MIKHLLQNKNAIMVGVILLTIANISTHRQVGVLQSTQAALMGLSFEDLSRQADLIILGTILDEKWATPGTMGAGLENHTVSVEKIIKGNYMGSTVGVITESQIVEDSPKFKLGERVILFLYQEPVFGDRPSGNDYTTVNLLQGKYDVDDVALVLRKPLASFSSLNS